MYTISKRNQLTRTLKINWLLELQKNLPFLDKKLISLLFIVLYCYCSLLFFIESKQYRWQFSKSCNQIYVHISDKHQVWCYGCSESAEVIYLICHMTSQDHLC